MLIHDTIDQNLSVFNFKSLQECVTLLIHVDQHGLVLTDVIDYIELKKSKMSGVTQKTGPDHEKSDRGAVSDHIPKCPACSNTLKLRESIRSDFESVLYCGCGYEYYNQISIVDHQMLVQAKMQNKDPDFSVDELRTPLEERKRRREICKTCDQLTVRNTCKACGCRMKHRTYYEILTCPKKFW